MRQSVSACIEMSVVRQLSLRILYSFAGKCLLYDVFNFLFRFALFPALFTNMLQIVCTVCDVQELLQTASTILRRWHGSLLSLD